MPEPAPGRTRYDILKVLLYMAYEEDKILDAALIAFVALSMKDPRHATELCRTSDLLPFLSLSIGVSQDEDVLVAPPVDQESLWARKQGLSRTDRTSVS